MTFSEYSENVKNYGYFSVDLGDNRARPDITDEVCEIILDKWLIPLMSVSQNVFIYQRKSAYSEEVTPPPKHLAPIVLGKTEARIELDHSKMPISKYRSYWYWAMRHRNRNITLVIPKDKFHVELFAKESWDPSILTNLAVVVARGSIQLARRVVAQQNVCCILSRESYNLECHIFAPPTDLLNYYKSFVVNCRFVSKGLERELISVRQNGG
jgi:hypothetical protein